MKCVLHRGFLVRRLSNRTILFFRGLSKEKIGKFGQTYSNFDVKYVPLTGQFYFKNCPSRQTPVYTNKPCLKTNF